MQTINTADQPRVSDQAIGVLRATSDGDLLAPAALALLQYAVNRGRDALSPAALSRWNDLVRTTEQGRYERPWLHGVEHLLKQHDGYVLWRGQVVEHYSYRDQREEAAAARHLGACCRLLEHRGQPVDARSLHALWTELDLGAGLELTRWQVLWSNEQVRAGATVHPLPGTGAQELLDARSAGLQQEAQRRQCDQRSMRSMVVVCLEDLQATLQAIDSDAAWAARARPIGNRWQAGCYEAMHEQVRACIDGEALPTRSQVLAQVLAPVSLQDDGDDETKCRAARPGERQHG